MKRSPLSRRASLRRVRVIRRSRRTGVPRDLRARVLDCWDWRCQGCGKTLGQCLDQGLRLELNHRLPKGRGGRDEFVNLIPLCGLGNTAGCHRLVDEHRLWAVRLGLAVQTGHDPADVPVQDWERRVWHVYDGWRVAA